MKRNTRLIAILLMLAMLFAGCAAKSEAPMEMGYSTTTQEFYAEDVMMEEVMEEEAIEMESAAMADSIEAIEFDTGSLKLIYNARIEMTSEQYTDDLQKIKENIKVYGGYISDESSYGKEPEVAGDAGRTSTLTARIPADAYPQFIEALKGIGKNISLEQSVEDVTDQYFDLESRLEVLELRKEKLEELLKQATEMEDIIILNEELSEIIYQIEKLSGSKRHLDNQINYSTVTIYIREYFRSTITTKTEKTLGERISESFGDTLYEMKIFFEDFVVFLIGASPVLLILAVIVVVIVLLIKRGDKKRMAKYAAKKAAEEAAKKETETKEENKTE
ncbi:MAG: DUF4349 domain-containing protein [Christensenellaceae bacterium]|nr:DUF4349 domain-containing protein [Christensenellaceae bacterium]